MLFQHLQTCLGRLQCQALRAMQYCTFSYNLTVAYHMCTAREFKNREVTEPLKQCNYWFHKKSRFEYTHIFVAASASGRLEWYWLLFRCFYLLFLYMPSFRRRGVWCAAYGCSNVYNKRKPGVGFCFSFSEAADAVSREVECLWLGPCISCSTVQNSVYSVDDGHLYSLDLARESKTFRLRGPSLGIQLPESVALLLTVKPARLFWLETDFVPAFPV